MTNFLWNAKTTNLPGEGHWGFIEILDFLAIFFSRRNMFFRNEDDFLKDMVIRK